MRLSLQRVAARVPRAWKIPLPSTPALRAPFRGRPLLYQLREEQLCLPAHVSAIEALGLPGYASSSAPFYFGGLILPCSLAVWDLPRRPGRGGWTGCLPGLARDAHGAPSAPFRGGRVFRAEFHRGQKVICKRKWTNQLGRGSLCSWRTMMKTSQCPNAENGPSHSINVSSYY